MMDIVKIILIKFQFEIHTQVSSKIISMLHLQNVFKNCIRQNKLHGTNW